MKLEDKISHLNKSLQNNAGEIWPSITYACIYGPIRGYLNPDTIEYLQDAIKVIEQRYNKFILPKTKNIFKVINDPFYSQDLDEINRASKILDLELTKEEKNEDIITSLNRRIIKLDSKIYPQTKKDLESKFNLIDFYNIKKIYQEKYIDQFEIPDEVRKELSCPILKSKENKYIDFLITENEVYSKRFKNDKRSFEKYTMKYLKLKKEDKDNYLNLINEIVSDPFNFWEKYSVYLEKGYSHELLESVMVADTFGMKEIILNGRRANAKIKQLKKDGLNLNFEGFNIIKPRFDDHTKRVKDFKPGGIHYTLTDCSMKNFPLEVQVLDLKSAIFDMFGIHSHTKYSIKRSLIENLKNDKDLRKEFRGMCYKFNLDGKNIIKLLDNNSNKFRI